MAGKLIVPGEMLGIEEEMTGNDNTYNENGEIFSAVIGKETVNEKRQIHVVPKKSVRMLKRGDIVYGKIMDLFGTVAMIDIAGANEKERAVIDSYAYLKITEIAKNAGFIRDFRQFMRIGDILKAKIIDVSPLGTYMTIADQGLGIVKAHCSKCRTELAHRGRLLICPECGNKEERKLAMD